MDDLTFLSEAAEGNAAVKVLDMDNEPKFEVGFLHFSTVVDRIPAITRHYEEQPDGSPAFIFKRESATAVISLLRWAFNASYLHIPTDLNEPKSLLCHLQMLSLARSLDLKGLEREARREIQNETQIAMSTPEPVINLVEAIHFLYLTLSDERSLRLDIAQYILQTWLYHGHSNNALLHDCISQCPRFASDLSQANINSSFESEGAIYLMGLPTCSNAEHKRLDGRLDFLCRLHYEHEGTVNYENYARSFWLEPDSLRPAYNASTSLVIRSIRPPLPPPPYAPPAEIEVADTDSSSFTGPLPSTPSATNWDGRPSERGSFGTTTTTTASTTRSLREDLEIIDLNDDNDDDDAASDLTVMAHDGGFTESEDDMGVLSDDEMEDDWTDIGDVVPLV